MSESRHNPDQLLKEIQADEENRNKGHLKIFFGYAAGVGKTYAMLEAAHMEKQQGIDVVAGYVETHARPKTAALLNGLEVLPTREVFYNGMILDEFDIGMALKRKPQLILVDELAHTNAEGCRHAKRYQDIKELLNAGIDVYTTVNVQHIESLCDTVASITEIDVRERIPDSIFDNADQVELIDIEPQDLINRMNTGNVYRQTQAKQAVENFFYNRKSDSSPGDFTAAMCGPGEYPHRKYPHKKSWRLSHRRTYSCMSIFFSIQCENYPYRRKNGFCF